MNIIKDVEKLKEEIGETVERRMKEFESMRKESNEKIFEELAFCILTANSSAMMGIKAQEEIGKGLVYLSQEELQKKLKNTGYRFWRIRTKYIIEARWLIPKIKNLFDMDEFKAREYLVKNVKGIGYKESSHFLRNTGAKNLAIIDRHILRVLHSYGIMEIPGYLTPKKYIEIEGKERKIAKRLNMSIGELDLYLWYMKTGKILK